MRYMNAIASTAAALALSAVMGCCENNPTTGAVNCRQPETNVYQPLLLSDALNNCPPPPVAKPLPLQTRGEVQGALVYNLGQGAISNSNAVLLAGGATKVTPINVPGGVTGRCNPLPKEYLDILASNQSRLPAPVPPLPASESPTAPELGSYDRIGYCAPTICPVPADAALVCQPGDNISDCFTLNEEELRSGPAIYNPVARTEAMPEEPTAPSAVDTSDSSKTETAPEAPQVSSSSETPTAPQPATEVKTAVAAPQTTDAVPPVTGKYENVTTAEALEPVKAATPEVEKMETIEKKRDTIEPERSSETAVIEKDAPPALPPSLETETAVKASADLEPMLPPVVDLDAAAESLLSSESRGTSSLPEVQLPPNLN